MMRFKGTDTFMARSNSFDSQTILAGIRRWVEIETPTEVPEQVNKLVSMVADHYRDLPATLGPRARAVRARLSVIKGAFREREVHGARTGRAR